MQISFYLRKDKISKDGFAPIRALISIEGKQIFKSIFGAKCLLQNWDEKKQRVKVSKKNEPYNNHIEFNKMIDEFETKFRAIERAVLINNVKPFYPLIKEKLDSDEKIIVSINLLAEFEGFITKNKSAKAARTTIGYITIFNYLKEYSEFTNQELTFETINLVFFEKFRDYSFEVKEIGSNYFSKIIQVLKTFMSWAFERELHTNLTYKKFKASEHEIEVIYLTMDELLTLFNFNFDSRSLEHVRDTYCFGCFSGLRFSDLKQLRTSNIFHDHIKLNVQKTKTIDHKIPLNKYSKSILEKYKNTICEPLPVISSQKFNKYLKECCRLAEISTLTTITRYSGNAIKNETLPKWELITSHTARKTFVTNSLVLGMNQMVVRSITGHKKESSFAKYVKISDEFKNKEMDNTWGKLEN